MSLICLVIAAVIFLLLGVKVDLGDKARWDFIGLFFLALGLALAYLPVGWHWPVVGRPNP